MEIKFEDLKQTKEVSANDSDIKLVVEKVKHLTLTNTLVFNYTETEDFKKKIPDFSGFLNTLRRNIGKGKYKIRSNRDTGQIEITLAKDNGSE